MTFSSIFEMQGILNVITEKLSNISKRVSVYDNSRKQLHVRAVCVDKNNLNFIFASKNIIIEIFDTLDSLDSYGLFEIGSISFTFRSKVTLKVIFGYAFISSHMFHHGNKRCYKSVEITRQFIHL